MATGCYKYIGTRAFSSNLRISRLGAIVFAGGRAQYNEFIKGIGRSEETVRAPQRHRVAVSESSRTPTHVSRFSLAETASPSFFRRELDAHAVVRRAIT